MDHFTKKTREALMNKENDIPLEGPSNIGQFYENSVIFVTGASGFLGCTLLEKLLRSCSTLSKIYILLRPKKGKSPEERLNELFNNVVYDRLKNLNPNFYEKISFILGDCEEPNLGMSDECIQKLIEEVNVVFHLAATVRFDEKLRKAVKINIRATKDILTISKKMKHLKVFVHVSTAYANCIFKDIDEVIYDVSMNGDKLMNIIDLLDDEDLDILTPKFIKPWPNTYTYTKAIAENMVRHYGKGLPITVVRPSIIASTFREPIPGWVNNYYGVTGVMYGISLGLMRTLRVYRNTVLDIIPNDFCVNHIIACGWITGKEHTNAQSNKSETKACDKLSKDNDLIIFNYVSGAENPIIINKLMNYNSPYGLEYPSKHNLWYYSMNTTSNKFVYMIYITFLHLIPAFIVDTSLKILGKEPMLLKAYEKVHKGLDVLKFFLLNSWNFKTQNTKKLYKKLNKADKHIFNFDMSSFDWRDYFRLYFIGIRVYLHKDPLDSLPEARRKYFKLKILHYTIVTILWYCFLRFIWFLLNMMF